MNKTVYVVSVSSFIGKQCKAKLVHEDGEEFTMYLPAEDVSGWKPGMRLKHSLVPEGEKPTEDLSELDSAYATIADLVEQVKALAPRAAKALTMKRLSVASLVLNAVLGTWIGTH